ncbi:ATP-binding protein, partial [Patescibacteria group bacterium]|nr:ATP-binding protein [Patescibacteria group bacterium]
MNLKLISFRVQNFRCVIDTAWQNLSVDNITGIIGQNESGKSSIVEALNSFYTNKISPDDVRSTGGCPRISCSFTCSDSFIEELVNNEQIKSEVKDFLKEKKRINLVREWQDSKTSTLFLEEDAFKSYFKEDEAPVTSEAPPVEENTQAENADAAAESSTSTETPKPAVSLLDEEKFIKLIVGKLPIFEFFEDFSSLLPNQIDLEDVQNQKKDVEGYKGAINLLALADLDLKFLTESDDRIIANRIRTTNKKITADFREYWSQKIGKTNKISLSIELKNYPDTNKKAGKPYLAFWVEDGEEKLYPKQRSQGVRWFLSFYLQLKASKIKAGTDADRGQVMLIDEPGMSLHAKAQEDVLKVFDDINETITVIYTTHSPYLVKVENLYRLLAAQRKDEDDENS